jgi:hypothetical protein
MKDSIELYIQHPTDWQLSEYVIVDYYIGFNGKEMDDLDIENWHPADYAEWITEEIVFNELLNQINKQNEQSN